MTDSGTHVLDLEDPLGSEARATLDRVCGSGGLPAVASLLEERFDLRVSLDPDVIEGVLTDASNLPGRAEALCRPETTLQCAAALRAARAARIPVTVGAGLSNLTGSATPEGGLVISMSRMTRPGPRVDEERRRVTSPVGIILEELREQVLRATGGRLMYPVDPTSRTDAAVGGTIATNASGFVPGPLGPPAGGCADSSWCSRTAS